MRHHTKSNGEGLSCTGLADCMEQRHVKSVSLVSCIHHTDMVENFCQADACRMSKEHVGHLAIGVNLCVVSPLVLIQNLHQLLHWGLVSQILNSEFLLDIADGFGSSISPHSVFPEDLTDLLVGCSSFGHDGELCSLIRVEPSVDRMNPRVCCC